LSIVTEDALEGGSEVETLVEGGVVVGGGIGQIVQFTRGRCSVPVIIFGATIFFIIEIVVGNASGAEGIG